jgi:hypothetical protein
MCAAIYLRPVALSFVNIIVDQIWLKATIFGLLIPGYDLPVGSFESFDERLNAAAVMVRNDYGHDNG